jgi:hypothetical protein
MLFSLKTACTVYINKTYEVNGFFIDIQESVYTPATFMVSPALKMMLEAFPIREDVFDFDR